MVYSLTKSCPFKEFSGSLNLVHSTYITILQVCVAPILKYNSTYIINKKEFKSVRLKCSNWFIHFKSYRKSEIKRTCPFIKPCYIIFFKLLNTKLSFICGEILKDFLANRIFTKKQYTTPHF